jgi:hypothetical protein
MVYGDAGESTGRRAIIRHVAGLTQRLRLNTSVVSWGSQCIEGRETYVMIIAIAV